MYWNILGEFDLMNSFFIGNVEIEKTAALAPMASVADKSYRLMCKEYGASYLVSEMISSKGLCFGDKRQHVFARSRKRNAPMLCSFSGKTLIIWEKRLISSTNIPLISLI